MNSEAILSRIDSDACLRELAEMVQVKSYTQTEGERRLAQLMHDKMASLGLQTELVPVEDVLYFLAEQKYVTACLRNGEVLLEDSLKNLEQEFEHSFVRIHRNALIARSQLAGLDKRKDDQVVVLLRDTDKQLDVSRRHVPGLRKLLRKGHAG